MARQRHQHESISRRRLLVTGAAAALGVTVLPNLAGCASDDSHENVDAFWLTIAGAAHAEDPSLTGEAAASELRPEFGSLDDADIESPSPSLLQKFEKQNAADFAAGNTVEVLGWSLSRTEVLFATIAAGTRS